MDFDLTFTSIILIGFGVAVACRLLLSLLIRPVSNQSHPSAFRRTLRTLRNPLFWTIIAISVALAISTLSLTPTLQFFIYHALITALIIIWFSTIYFALPVALSLATANFNQKYRRNISDAIPFLLGLSRGLLVFTAAYLLFSAWGINLTPLLAVISVIGAALSFAARDSVGNVISGFGIFLSRPFKVGDFVFIDDKYKGSILETSLQMTKLVTPQNTVINIPNTIIVTKPLVNHFSLNPYYRLNLPLTLPTTVDLKSATQILLDAAAANTWVLKKPSPRVRLHPSALTEYKLELTVMLEKPAQAAKVQNQILKTCLPQLAKLTPSTAAA